jgi:pimeloyl-ACP methyl ester carboxylesterase
MAVEIIMPKLGMTMTSGTLVRWLCESGEKVEAGQPVCEVESEKLNTDVMADVEGVLLVIVAEGEEAEVGAVLGQIDPVAGGVAISRRSDDQAKVKGSNAWKVPANGINLKVQQLGEGPAVILIHGFASSMELWGGLDPTKLEGHTLISYDLRGHGGSDRPSGAHTLVKHLADLEGLMAALGIARADLVGHSLGGMIAMELAATRPEKVGTLTLSSTTANFPQATKDMFYQLASSASFGGMGSIVNKLVNLSFSPQEANPKIITTLRQTLKGSDAASIASSARMVAKIDLTARLAAISCATQVLVGEQDELTPPPLAKQLNENIAGSRLYQFADCGHAAPIEQPQLVTGKLLELLSQS